MEIADRTAYDWQVVESQLLGQGFAAIPRFLDYATCESLRSTFDNDGLFRSRVVMERHGFGRGEYKYFAYPLPAPVDRLRNECYAGLAPAANRWNELLKAKERYPESQQQFLQLCAQGAQSRPTALLLHYRAGDYNCLHEDVYGALSFPFQITVFLSRVDEYEGGEFVLVEQQPRRQSRPVVLRPQQGDAVVIPNRYRPVRGHNGYYRTRFRHGVSEVRIGERFTLGLIFHDAQ